MMKKSCCVLFATALSVTVLAISPARAAESVKIGVIYPVTGNAASAGQSAKDAVNLGAEIVNTAHSDLKALPLGASAGLPNLGGAKIELDEADHQGNPQVGQQQTLRLITQDHVVAMLGSYHSSRRAPGHPLSGRGFGGAEHYRTRL
jgi:branched-chain amino acid transport system substrate-binding protein